MDAFERRQLQNIIRSIEFLYLCVVDHALRVVTVRERAIPNSHRYSYTLSVSYHATSSDSSEEDPPCSDLTWKTSFSPNELYGEIVDDLTFAGVIDPHDPESIPGIDINRYILLQLISELLRKVNQSSHPRKKEVLQKGQLVKERLTYVRLPE